MTQRSPCYSASLTNPLPDCSSYSPFCHTHYLTLRINRCFTKPLRWILILHCNTLLQNLVGNSYVYSEEYCSALWKLNNKQRQVVMFLLLLFKLSSQLPFVSLFSLSLSSLCSLTFSIISLLPFLISPSLSTISSDQLSVLLR